MKARILLAILTTVLCVGSVQAQRYSKDDPSNYTAPYGVVFSKDKTVLIHCPAGFEGDEMEYDIPEGVTTIAEGAFQGCGELVYIYIPASVKTIGARAFYKCGSLGFVDIANPNPPAIDKSVFEGIGNTLKLADWMLSSEDDTKLTLGVPKGALARYKAAPGWKDAFEKFKEIEFEAPAAQPAASAPQTRDTYVPFASAGVKCTPGQLGALLKIEAERDPVAERMKELGIGSSLLKEKSAPKPRPLSELKQIHIDGSMDARDFRFLRENCRNLRDIFFGDDFTVAAYSGTEGLASGEYRDYPANALPDKAFMGMSELGMFMIPKQITTIMSYACYGCRFMYLSNSVTAIGDYAFGMTSCLRFDFPAAVTRIGNGVLDGCGKLEYVAAFGKIPPKIDGSLGSIDYDKIKLVVPKGTLKLYKKAPGWKKFKNIVESKVF